MARPRASDFDAEKQGLLTAAAHVFARQGMEKASMAQVAAQGGVSKALLYHYYPGKEALIFAIIAGHLTDLDHAIAAADDDAASPQARLRALIGAVLENYRDADDAHQVQLNALQALPQAQRDAIHRIERRIVGRFSNVLTAINPALASGPVPRLMPVTMSIFGMMNWVYMWFRESGPITRADYADIAAELVLNGINP